MGNKTSQVRGITWDKDRGRWIARRTVDGYRKKIGQYRSQQEAVEALEKFDQQEYENSFLSLSNLIETEPERKITIKTPSFVTRLFKRFGF